jgi:GNAT superfamily N-acetyltransferase
VIRMIRTEDWQLLRDVRLRALAGDPDAFLDTHARSSALPAEHWQERATPSDAQASFAIERDGRFEGLVACFVADDPETVFLVAMWVAPELRGTGVARGLVEQVVEWARDRGASRVTLSVEEWNDRAAALYERCGFVATTAPPPFPYEPNPGNRFYVYEL